MPQSQRLAQIEQACLALLQQHPDGISEYSLLKRLREKEYALFPKLELDDTLGLFQSHFLLFHCLYRLQSRLYQEQQAELKISALIIELGDYRAGEVALCECDPLRDYYLELGNLNETGEADVIELLGNFWRGLQLDSNQIEAALRVLELEQAESFVQVKAQYRRLVMQHHPDRGGEAVQMHALNEALEVMRLHFKC